MSGCVCADCEYKAALILIRDGTYDVTDSVIWMEGLEGGAHPKEIARAALKVNEEEKE